MKILVIASTLDLKYKLACTPSWWQLLKALKEIGNELIVVPYLGKAIETPWWRTYNNPCDIESRLYNSYLESKKRNGKSPSGNDIFSPLSKELIDHYIKPKWENHIKYIMDKEKGVDFVFLMNVPIDHINGVVKILKNEYHVPVAYYDGDMPTILPKYAVDRGFKFNYYAGVDLSDYDVFFSNSKGVIPDLKVMGAKNVVPLYYATDPELFKPVDVKKDIDVFFYGYGNELRDDWMNKMITEPSKKMPSTNFLIAGSGFTIDLGKANVIKDIPNSALSTYCCRSKVNLNITRSSHANIYASSTTRLFELASLGACIVSQPYNGIEEWFDVGKELIIVNSEHEAIETYKWLLSDDEERSQMGERIRKRVLKDHTYMNRAHEIIDKLRQVKIK